LKLRKWRYEEWNIFKRYHYLDHWLNKACSPHIYILEYENEPIGFCSVIHFPHPSNDKIKKIHRLVIRPDYQWLWIGIKFLEEVMQIYIKQWFDARITTSNFALLFGLKNRKNWICCHYGKQVFSKTDRLWADLNRKTATFKYIMK